MIVAYYFLLLCSYLPKHLKHQSKNFELIYNFFLLFWLFSEIEAVEACKWLRAAGFPQYAQMYEGKLNKNKIQNLSFHC